jgi:GNAT superfamily N-acetyltransferase
MTTIREAGDGDLPNLLRAYAESGIASDDAYTVEEARRQFAVIRGYPSYRIFIAEIDGRFAGTYALILIDNLNKRGARAAIVEDVAVLPEFQGRGVGREMMEHAREQCRIAGCYKMALSSNLKREGAHAFYDSLGFERHGYSFVIRP